MISKAWSRFNSHLVSGTNLKSPLWSGGDRGIPLNPEQSRPWNLPWKDNPGAWGQAESQNQDLDLGQNHVKSVRSHFPGCVIGSQEAVIGDRIGQTPKNPGESSWEASHLPASPCTVLSTRMCLGLTCCAQPKCDRRKAAGREGGLGRNEPQVQAALLGKTAPWPGENMREGGGPASIPSVALTGPSLSLSFFIYKTGIKDKTSQGYIFRNMFWKSHTIC